MLSVSQSEPIQTVDPEFNADPSPSTVPAQVSVPNAMLQLR